MVLSFGPCRALRATVGCAGALEQMQESEGSKLAISSTYEVILR
jgi:hypothetical protein